MTKERRKYLRADSALKVWLGHEGVFDRRDEKLIVLGAGGSYIQTKRELLVGSFVNMRFQLHSQDEFITCQAVVRAYDKGQGAGVEFIDLSKEERLRIKAFVESSVISEVMKASSTAKAEALVENASAA